MADEASLSKIDWTDIAYQFALLRSEVRGSQHPSRAEVDRYKASLAKPAKISSSLPEQLDASQRHVIEDAKRLQMLQYSWQILGISQPDPGLPEWMRARLANHMEVVENGIARRSLTLEFLHSWGEVRFAFGVLSAILLDDEASQEPFFKKMNDAVRGRDTTIQKHWYAFWLLKDGVFDDPQENSRYSSNRDIIELCLDIYRGRRKAVDYSVSWFRSLIYLPEPGGKSPVEPDSQDEECRLNRIYRDLTIDEIKEIIKHPAIELRELPPLSPDSYPEIPQS